MESFGGPSPMRAKRVDLTDANADLLFTRNVTAASLTPGLDGLFAYPGSNMKHVIDWSKVIPHRNVLFDAFTYSEGYLLHHKQLLAQLESFLKDVSAHNRITGKDDTTNAIYRLRLMMSHLRNAKVARKVVPPNAAVMLPVLEMIDTTSAMFSSMPASVGLAIQDVSADDLRVDDLSLDKNGLEMLPPPSPGTPYTLSSTSDEESASSAPVLRRPAARMSFSSQNDDDLDDILGDLFTPAKKKGKTSPAKTTPTKKTPTKAKSSWVAVSEAISPPAQGTLSDKELDELCSSVPAPSPADFRSLKAAIKRPAAANAKANGSKQKIQSDDKEVETPKPSSKPGGGKKGGGGGKKSKQALNK